MKTTEFIKGKLNFHNLLILSILLLSFLVIFIKLGSVPPGVLIDEASLGYNAYSVLKTGRDEWGNLFPLTLKSFGDYKPAGYIYFSIPFIKLFGLNPFSVRLPSAIAGVISVLSLYWVVRLLTNNKTLALYCSMILAIAPWHIYMNRMAWESNISLVLFLLGLILLLKKPNTYINLIISSLLFSLSLNVYVGYKLSTPLLLIGFLYFLYKKKIIKMKLLLVFLISLLLFSLPYISDSIFKGGLTRLSQVSIFNQVGTKMFIDEQRTFCGMQNNKTLLKLCYSIWNKPGVIFTDLIKKYLASFSTDFIFFTGDTAAFINNPDHGGLYYWLFPFFFIGILTLIGGLKKKEYQFILLWFLLAPIMSALAARPHFVRSNMILLPFVIICGLGVWITVKKISSGKKKLENILMITFFLASFISLFITIVDYLFVYTKKAMAWDEQYAYMYKYLTNIDSNYQKIYIRKMNTHPYIYMLFYQVTDPIFFKNNVKRDGFEVLSVGKYFFTDNDFNYIYCSWQKENKPKTILVTNDLNSTYDPLVTINSFNGVHSLSAIYDLEKTENYLLLTKQNVPTCR